MKNLILPLAGILSGALVGWLYTTELDFFWATSSVLPGTIFAVFIYAAILFLKQAHKSIRNFLLFLILSSAGYFTSVIIILSSDIISGPIALFLAGFIGGFLMLLGIENILHIKMKKMTLLSLLVLAGILVLAAALINFFIIEKGDYLYSQSIIPPNDPLVDSLIESRPGLFLLYILWNGTMALAISLIYNQKIAGKNK